MISLSEIKHLLSEHATPQEVQQLHTDARTLTDKGFGRRVFVRGLIEVTNVCRNGCLYCGIRAGARVNRYTLSRQEIIESCREAYQAGIRTFVMQGGENPALTPQWMADTVKELKTLFPEAAITLSLGEMVDDDYALLRDAGADRYLLRHETCTPAHYAALHPAEMQLDNRLRCLETLKRLGFQTGTGIMVGSPYQTLDHILEDIRFMLRLQPEMIGIGPFIPAAGTPFESFPAGSVQTTQRLVSVFRLLFPTALIPATTAVATLGGEQERINTLLAGANVVMPNMSPLPARKAYRLYDNKAASGLEAIEQLATLQASFAAAGLELTLDRGDAKKLTFSSV